jgi:hypothetical protein
MKLLPLITREFAQKIEQVDLNYTFSRLGGMQAADGNSLQIEIRQFGEATAFLIEAWPDFWYGNRVLGLGPADETHLEAILHFFEERSLPFRFEIIPGRLNWSLATRLHQLGFCQGSFSAAMYGPPQSELLASSPAVQVRAVEANELELFLDLYQDGFGLDRLSRRDKQIVGAWLEREAAYLRLYLATIEDQPAGVAILYLNKEWGLLADAATLPPFRDQGCQTALLHHRIEAAALHGCTLLTSFVEFGSASHRNVARAGLNVAYTKALWWRVEKIQGTKGIGGN